MWYTYAKAGRGEMGYSRTAIFQRVSMRVLRGLFKRGRTFGVCVMLCAAYGIPFARAATDAPAAGAAPTSFAPRDIVLLVDVSSSMDDIFPTVQDALHTFVDGCRTGDAVALVSFSDSARTVDEVTIVGPGDRQQLHDTITGLQPSGRFTNITTALRRGTQWLRDARNSEGDVPRVRLVLLITDGRHNPPDVATAPTFDEALNRYDDFVAGSDWFVHYITVGDVNDDATLSFIQGARGQITELDKEQVGELSLVLDDLEVPRPAVVRDVVGSVRIETTDGEPRPAASGETVPVGGRLVTGARGRALMGFNDFGLIGMDPNTTLEVLQVTINPILRRRTVVLAVPRGRVWAMVNHDHGPVAFRILSPHAESVVTGTLYTQEVLPGAGGTRLAVTRGSVRVSGPGGFSPVDLPAGMATVVDTTGQFSEQTLPSLELASALALWREVLERRTRLTDLVARFAGLHWQELEGLFDDVRPGRRYTQTLQVDLSDLASPDLRANVVALALPAQLDLQAEIVPPGVVGTGQATVKLALIVAADWIMPKGGRYMCEIELQGSRIPPDLRLRFPVELVAGQSLVAPVTLSDELPIWLWPMVGSGLALVFALGFVIWRSNTGLAVPLGRLLLLKNPYPQQWETTSLDLEALCKYAGTDIVTIGSANDNLIALPDPRVQAYHASIRVRGRDRANRKLYIYVEKGAKVRLNTTTIRRGPIELLDGMRLRVGAFVFEYEDTRTAEQVEIAMAGKRLLHGVLRSWDLTKHTFSVSTEDRDLEAKETMEREIAFIDVEDISILQRPDRKSWQMLRARKKTLGPEVTIEMESGRTHHGHVRQDYDEKRERFYFFPTDRPTVDYMIIEREHMRAISFSDSPTPRR